MILLLLTGNPSAAQSSTPAAAGATATVGVASPYIHAPALFAVVGTRGFQVLDQRFDPIGIPPLETAVPSPAAATAGVGTQATTGSLTQAADPAVATADIGIALIGISTLPAAASASAGVGDVTTTLGSSVISSLAAYYLPSVQPFLNMAFDPIGLVTNQTSTPLAAIATASVGSQSTSGTYTQGALAAEAIGAIGTQTTSGTYTQGVDPGVATANVGTQAITGSLTVSVTPAAASATSDGVTTTQPVIVPVASASATASVGSFTVVFQIYTGLAQYLTLIGRNNQVLDQRFDPIGMSVTGPTASPDAAGATAGVGALNWANPIITTPNPASSIGYVGTFVIPQLTSPALFQVIWPGSLLVDFAFDPIGMGVTLITAHPDAAAATASVGVQSTSNPIRVAPNPAAAGAYVGPPSFFWSLTSAVAPATATGTANPVSTLNTYTIVPDASEALGSCGTITTLGSYSQSVEPSAAIAVPGPVSYIQAGGSQTSSVEAAIASSGAGDIAIGLTLTQSVDPALANAFCGTTTNTSVYTFVSDSAGATATVGTFTVLQVSYGSQFSNPSASVANGEVGTFTNSLGAIVTTYIELELTCNPVLWLEVEYQPITYKEVEYENPVNLVAISD